MYRIFIVEDDPGIAEGIKRQAEAWGLEVRCADDLRNVMGEFAAFSPHLVLLDITPAVFQRLSLVQRDPHGVESADNIHILGGRQHEHRHGNEHGRG